MKTFPVLDHLIACLGRLPGIGRRSAERLALALITQRESLLPEILAALQQAHADLCGCARCGNITLRAANPCRFCTDPGRDGRLLCVVSDPAHVWQIENTGTYRGRYHVLPGTLNPMRGVGAETLGVTTLIQRIRDESIAEIILALNTDVESEATAALLQERLAGLPVVLTRPALGIPTGSGVAYADALTLARALERRQKV